MYVVFRESLVTELNLHFGYIAQLKLNKTAAARYLAKLELDVPVPTGYATVATLEIEAEAHGVPALAVMYRDAPTK